MCIYVCMDGHMPFKRARGCCFPPLKTRLFKGGRTQQRAPPVDPDINLFPANTPPVDNTRSETMAQQQQKYTLRSCSVLVQLLVVSYLFTATLHTSSELKQQGAPRCLSSCSHSLDSAHLNSSGWILYQARFLWSEDFPSCADLYLYLWLSPINCSLF